MTGVAGKSGSGFGDGSESVLVVIAPVSIVERVGEQTEVVCHCE